MFFHHPCLTGCLEIINDMSGPLITRPPPWCVYYADVNAFAAADYCRRLHMEYNSMLAEADGLRAEMQALSAETK